MMGGTASQDGNFAQLTKLSKEKPPINRNFTRTGNFFRMHLMTILRFNGVVNYARVYTTKL